MPMQWSMLWTRSLSSARNSKCNPMADPLEGREWEGLAWSVLLVATLLRGRRTNTTQESSDGKFTDIRRNKFDYRLIATK